jgi:hypothetical protein
MFIKFVFFIFKGKNEIQYAGFVATGTKSAAGNGNDQAGSKKTRLSALNQVVVWSK